MVVTQRPCRTGFTFALALLAGGVALALWAVPVQGQAIIDNGVIQMGVNIEGDLDVMVNGGVPVRGGTAQVCPCIGVTYMPTGNDGTAPGCACETWGVSYDEAVAGFSRGNDASPGAGLVPLPFTSTASTAVSTVLVGDLTVVHDYHPSSHTNLYEATVTITNNGPVAHNNLRYRRAMDWDIAPTTFSEVVTIEGDCPLPTALVYSSDQGFATGNPLLPPLTRETGAPHQSLGPPDCSNFFYDSGPADHGALFDFNFGPIAGDGGQRIFNIFYGATATESAAYSALDSVNAQIWSLGQPSSDPTGGTPNTFIFAFDGVWVAPPEPSDPPPPPPPRSAAKSPTTRETMPSCPSSVLPASPQGGTARRT